MYNFLSTLFIFTLFVDSEAQYISRVVERQALKCHQPIALNRPGLQHVRDACCPDDASGKPYTKEIQECCCDMVIKKSSNKFCCTPDGCNAGTHYAANKGDHCVRRACTLTPTVHETGHEYVCNEGNDPGATCNFGCAEGYEIFDKNNDVADTTSSNETAAICNKDTFNWNITVPENLCCVPSCPSLPDGTKLDFMIVLDKSSSIGNANFGIVRSFLHRMIDILPLNVNSGRMSIMTYNSIVERVFDFSESLAYSKDELKTRVDDIVYSGRGTRTYLGLQDVYDNEISSDPLNRPDVEDMLLVITDGVSRGQAEINRLSREIKSKGVEFYAIGIGREVSPEQVEKMASTPASKYTKIINAFEELEEVAENFLTYLCPVKTCPE